MSSGRTTRAVELNAHPVGPHVQNRLELLGHSDSWQGIADEELAAGFGLEMEPLGELALMGGADRPFLGDQVDRGVGMLSFPADLRRLEPVAQARRGALGLIAGPPGDRSGQDDRPGRNHGRNQAVNLDHRLETSVCSGQPLINLVRKVAILAG